MVPSIGWATFNSESLLGLLAEIKVFAVLPAYFPMILDAGAVLESLPLLICTDFVYCHCTERWVVFNNNTHGKDSGAFR